MAAVAPLQTPSKTPSKTNPHLDGNLAPVRAETTVKPKILGKIPEGLSGALYRNGPNPQFDPGPKYHAFLGDGMIHGFWVGEGRALYSNRYVRTPKWELEHTAGRALFGGFDPREHRTFEMGLRAWVEAHRGQWDHEDWLALLEDLKRSAFWPMEPDAVGQALEDAKRELISTTRTERVS